MIVDIRPSKSWIVETDEDTWFIHRRNGPDNWEVMMGESWEQFYNCEELEKEFQLYVAREGI